MFAVLYEDKPSEAEKEKLLSLLNHRDPNHEDGILEDLFRHHPFIEYDNWINALKDYLATIKLFKDALKDYTKWPSNDVAVLQEFDNKPPSHLVVKLGWCMGLYSQSVQPASSNGGVTQSGDKIMGTG